MDVTLFSQTVEKIYDAALDDRVWPAALQGVSNIHRGVRAFLYTPLVPVEQGGYVLTHDPVQVTEIQRWSSRYGAIDPWVEAVQRKGLVQENFPILSQDLIPDDELVQHSFYTEFLKHHNARHLCTGLVFLGRDPDLPTLVCAVHRGINDPMFDETNRHLHGLLLRHLSRAVGLMTELRTRELQAAASLSALDLLSGAVLLLNRVGQVVFANRAAYAVLAREDGLMLKASLTSEGHLGYLTGETPAITHAIEAEVASALQSDTEPVSHFGSGLAAPQATGKGQWIIRVAPLTEHGRVLHGLNTAKVIMFLHDTSSVWTLQPDLLKQMYGLTLAESRVAQALLQHGSPAEIAHVLGVGESTIRSQLKAIFEKTNTHRQADLVKLLMGIAKSEA